MNRSIKSALLSAFIFPGAGHIFLKKYFIGAILTGAACGALYVIVSKSLERAMLIVDKIENGEVQLDIATIAELVSKQPIGDDAQLLNISAAALVICWVVGVVDTYRVGRLQDRKSLK
ncbi:MAG: hypothetical protein COC05_04985 [Gammaproteobacteria bacterium]|nr:MAG: hypothetical protein COC05_04985 [Gammaproteobacteria bacterium]